MKKSAFRVAQRTKALHRSVAQSLQPGVRAFTTAQAVSLPAVTGSTIGWRTIGPSSGLGKGLTRGALLGSSCSSDSLWQTGHLQADFGRQLNCVFSDTLVQLVIIEL